jgi:signal transduction histidine kinase
MSIRNRLALGIVAIALVLTVPLLSALRALERLRSEISVWSDQDFAASLLLGRMRASTEELRQAETALGIDLTEETRAAFAAEIAELTARADSLSAYTADSAARIVQRAVDEIEIVSGPQFAAARAGQVDLLDSLTILDFRPALVRVEQAIGNAERALGARTRDRVTRVAAATERAWEMSALMLMLATGLVAAIAIWLTRSVSRPVRELETGMRCVADGDFEHRLPIRTDRPDEFGELATSFETMAAQLAQLDRIKAEFMSVASHELKTPLNVIMGYLQLLDEGLYGELSPRQREICGTLRTQAGSLARLVHQLLDVSRFEAGGAHVEPRDIVLAAFLDDLERAFDVLAHQRGVSFRIATCEVLPPTVRWDLDRMNEVLGNLLSNAFKFTERGGRVELAVDLVRDGDADGLQLVVRDTGAGIPPEQLPHVFQKFYQADNQEQAAHAGTGLGLAIAKQIVEAHHGSIVCESAVGEGTTFTILIPVAVDVPVRLPRPALIASEVT